MSEILVVINSKNADQNNLHEIAGAIGYLGGSDVSVNEESLTLTATVPSSHVPTLQLIEGVTYVRPTTVWYRKSA